MLRTKTFWRPTVVAGPYVNAQVSSDVFDHASIPASVLRLHELPSINTREAAAADVWSLLDEQRLLDGRPQPGIAMPSIEIDAETIYADDCRGSPLHRPVGAAPSSTGQPELERFMDARWPGHAKDGRRDQMTTWMRVLDHARRLGVLA